MRGSEGGTEAHEKVPFYRRQLVGCLPYTYGAPLVACAHCGMKGNSDRNASLVIGQRLVERYQKPSKEKPHTPLKAGRAEQSAGGVVSQDAKRVGSRPSNARARHGNHNEHGTAEETGMRMVAPVLDIACQLRFPF